MQKKTVCVLGGTGFVGTHLVEKLAEAGYQLRVPTRHPERHRELLVLPHIDLVEADVADDGALAALLGGCAAAVNLVGILHPRGDDTFQHVHVELPRRLARACKAAGVRRLLHMSALGAHAGGASEYLRSKGRGEDAVHAEADDKLAVTSFRPSVIFGPGDHFFEHFAGLLARAPLLPLPCPQARFAPVFVGDVVGAMVRALVLKATCGQRYDLCGPKSYTLLELVEYTASVLGLKRRIIPLSDAMSRRMARLGELAPGRPFTRDNYLSMQTDAVCSGPFPEVFGITPGAVEALVPYYLGHQDQRGLYDTYRRQARHEY
ncbi:MAG TPA: complex I NDUFA9 subunit family protein [Gammaproteobacteria bacterium]|nr:complex I NDUFA9 subunit family protein [Gammaproteobacteria bacterium]